MKTRKVLYISWQAQTTSTDTVYYRQHLHDLEKKCRPLQCEVTLKPCSKRILQKEYIGRGLCVITINKLSNFLRGLYHSTGARDYIRPHDPCWMQKLEQEGQQTSYGYQWLAASPSRVHSVLGWPPFCVVSVRCPPSRYKGAGCVLSTPKHITVDVSWPSTATCRTWFPAQLTPQMQYQRW